MTSAPSSEGSRLWTNAAVVAAAITAVATVLVAVIQNTGEQAPSGSRPAAAPTPTPTDADDLRVQVRSWRQEALAPPPRHVLTYLGEVEGLGSAEQIFVMSTAPDVSSGAERHSVSPPAAVAADGSWSVRWVLDQPPAAAAYKVVVIAALPLTGPGGPLDLRDALAQSGLESAGVRAVVDVPSQ